MQKLWCFSVLFCVRTHVDFNKPPPHQFNGRERKEPISHAKGGAFLDSIMTAVL